MTRATGDDRTGDDRMGGVAIAPGQIEGNASATSPPNKKEKPNRLKRPSGKEKPNRLKRPSKPKRPNGLIKRRPGPKPPTR